ncbi:MAG: acetylxylan esterase [Planctomycetes bacterium]|nr:acetylxylan esterase [Planctomycetota bacterium]
MPDPLVTSAGKRVATAAEWPARQAELVELFAHQVYGRAPIGRPGGMTITVTEAASGVMDGAADRRQLRLAWKGPGGDGGMNVVLFVPTKREKPVGCFLLICNRPVENIDPTREKKSGFWPAEAMIARGYAIAAFHNAEVDPDKHDGFKDGVHGVFDEPGKPRADDAWATIAAWAWGASRAIDALVEQPGIDAKRIAVVGHSRGGKTALWCGAQDERVALTISNNSGCSGAAITRGKEGERVAKINASFPHWFTTTYKQWNERENDMPFDQHQLLASIAPRLVYVASATEDTWADPKAEFRACVEAAPVWALFEQRGFPVTTFPAPESPLHEGRIGYHLRTGKHDLTEYDWLRYADFADKYWK